VLKEIEAMAGKPLYQCFDLIFTHGKDSCWIVTLAS
jgi:hypothetical protein